MSCVPVPVATSLVANCVIFLIVCPCIYLVLAFCLWKTTRQLSIRWVIVVLSWLLVCQIAGFTIIAYLTEQWNTETTNLVSSLTNAELINCTATTLDYSGTLVSAVALTDPRKTTVWQTLASCQRTSVETETSVDEYSWVCLSPCELYNGYKTVCEKYFIGGHRLILLRNDVEVIKSKQFGYAFVILICGLMICNCICGFVSANIMCNVCARQQIAEPYEVSWDDDVVQWAA
jgi:hypothetical protein